MVKKVVFFNFFHNGDLHVSRNFVKEISKICIERGIPCEYYFECFPGILDDIENVKFVREKETEFMYSTPSFIRDDVLYFNTWYAANQEAYNKYKISFDTLFYGFKPVCQMLDINLRKLDVLSLFPSINYEKFPIENAKQWLGLHNKKRVFISNGDVSSEQAVNFSMATIINKLAEKHKDIDFLISNETPEINNRENIFLTKNIIQKDGNDLNENSYLASNCFVIVGRYSGSYTYSITRENYFDNPKKFIAFTNLDAVWTYNYTDKPKADILFFNENEENKVYKLISDNIFRNL